jgi:GNAT superfamily N-acetyltransferase
MKSVQIQKKDGVTYSHVPEIGGTILVPLFYKHLAELMEAGHCTFQTFNRVTDTSQGIIAEIDNKIVGFGIFDHKKGEEELFDVFIYVDPDYRQRGIFVQLQNGLLTYAKNNKVDYINSFISIKNEVSIKAHRKMGYDLFISEYLPEFYQYIHSTY